MKRNNAKRLLSLLAACCALILSLTGAAADTSSPIANISGSADAKMEFYVYAQADTTLVISQDKGILRRQNGMRNTVYGAYDITYGNPGQPAYVQRAALEKGSVSLNLARGNYYRITVTPYTMDRLTQRDAYLGYPGSYSSWQSAPSWSVTSADSCQLSLYPMGATAAPVITAVPAQQAKATVYVYYRLLDGSLITYPELYRQRLGRDLRLNAVGGPCTSYELADLDPTTVCFCGEDARLLRKLRDMLRTDYYHISITTDVTGLETAVALKNAYALGVSLAIGLAEKRDGKQHYNSQAALFGQSVKEMRRLLRHLGGGEDNIIFGAGDLYVTVFGGRTRMIGTLLGRGLSFAEAREELKGVTLESVVIVTRAAAAVRKKIELGELREADFPLLLHGDDILSRGREVDIPWQAFEEDYL